MHVHDKRKWQVENIPNLQGKTALITGGDRGLGAEIVKVLVAHQADVVLLGNDAVNMKRFAASFPQTLDFHLLDLSDLTSVANCATEISASHSRIELLVNNAGVMMLPFGVSKQGFERHFAINHLGHFALTGRLLPLLAGTHGSRIVTMASNGHKIPGLNFEDVRSDDGYSPLKAYGRSKLANLLFTQELARRLELHHIDTVSVAAHPGQSSTNPHGNRGISRLFDKLFGQSPARGAEPALRAATDPDVQQGDYFGPSGFLEMRGDAVIVRPAQAALNGSLAQELWEQSMTWTGVHYL